jgi:hypothetical protein
MISFGQYVAATLFIEAGIEDRVERLGYATAVVGRAIDSSRDLTIAEAGEVIVSLLAGIGEPTHELSHEELPP